MAFIQRAEATVHEITSASFSFYTPEEVNDLRRQCSRRRAGIFPPSAVAGELSGDVPGP